MNECEAGTAWWRPERARLKAVALDPGSRAAFLGLVAFTAILLLTPQSMIPALKSLRIALLAAGVAIVVHVFGATLRRQPVIPFSPEMAITLTLLAWTVMTIPFSIWPGGSIALLTDQYLKAIIFFWLIGTLVTTRERMRTFAWTLAVCSIPLAVIGLQHFQSGDFLRTGVPNLRRIEGYAGLSGNPNDLALTLNLLIPIAAALLFSTRGVKRCLAGGALALSAATVILTFSRAGFLTLATIVLMSLVFLVKRRAPAAAVAVLVVTCSIIPFLPEGYIDRLSTITDIEADQTGSAQGRWADYQAAAQIVSQNPVIGVGMGQDILALNDLRGPTWRSVHNAFLEYAVDLGVPGILLFLWLLIASFRSARAVERHSAGEPALRDVRLLAEGVQISLAAFTVAAFFHPIAYQFYFFCVAGMAVALKAVYRAEHRTLVPEQA